MSIKYYNGIAFCDPNFNSLVVTLTVGLIMYTRHRYIGIIKTGVFYLGQPLLGLSSCYEKDLGEHLKLNSPWHSKQ